MKELILLSLLFENEEEKALAEAVESLFCQDCKSTIRATSCASPVIDAFFENTMVMAEDQAVSTKIALRPCRN